MPKVVGYHRPASVQEALQLLSQPSAAVLAGGTRVNATPSGSPLIAVDIQSLGLGGITVVAPGRMRLGASVTLQQMVDSADLPDVVRDCARREEPSTLRTLATIGGTVAAGGWESELVAALLAAEAVVGVETLSGAREHRLDAILADCDLLVGTLITSVTISTDGAWGADRTGRTPGDRAIVAAIGRRAGNGSVRVALSGVAPTPLIVQSADGLSPKGDFRGTSEYRKHLATILFARVTEAVSA